MSNRNFPTQKIKIETCRHIESGDGFTVAGCTASADIRRNPYYPDPEGGEPKHCVQNIKVIDEGGRNVTLQILDWEMTEIYFLLTEAFEEKEAGDYALHIDEQIQRALDARAA